MDNKRRNQRKTMIVTTVIHKLLPQGGYAIMEFKSKDMSLGGVFISTEDLSLFDLGQELDILVDDGGRKYYEGQAVAVRSARIFTEEGGQVESGYGLMFLSPAAGFKQMLVKRLEGQA